MKVRFEFDTDDENFSQAELEAHYQAWRLVHCISEIQDRLRSWLKYDACPRVDEYSHFWNMLSDEQKKFYAEERVPDLDKMTDEIYDIINDNVNMEHLRY